MYLSITRDAGVVDNHMAQPNNPQGYFFYTKNLHKVQQKTFCLLCRGRCLLFIVDHYNTKETTARLNFLTNIES